MTFYEIKGPHHQAEPDSCVPTTIKVMLSNQFEITKSISTIKKWCGWQRGGVEPYRAIRKLDQPLSKLKVSVYEKSNLTEKHLIELLDNGIIPVIYFRMNYLNESESNEVEVDEEGTRFFHPIVPVGFENEKVYIYDCFMKGYGKSLPKSDIKVTLKLPIFLREWQHTSNKAFWFVSDKSKNKQLSEFPEFKK
ncbi:MAG: hypothetical protein KKH52_02170 [Nanoarchaeota archaeon]|nr:hypothetical protein [Nanoarchaeota archaeon]MBU1622325.1 hypothetical protein [Nanoarchaeota archaeon]MBU1974178.1 hypothetical protein [Nanoarchaeota archaeon]